MIRAKNFAVICRLFLYMFYTRIYIINIFFPDNNRPLKYLPVLELDSGYKVFSANAAAEYILQSVSGRRSTLEDGEWLEWEASQLQVR